MIETFSVYGAQERLVLDRLPHYPAGDFPQPVDRLGWQYKAGGKVHEVCAFLGVLNPVKTDVEHVQVKFRHARLGLGLRGACEAGLGDLQLPPPAAELHDGPA